MTSSYISSSSNHLPILIIKINPQIYNPDIFLVWTNEHGASPCIETTHMVMCLDALDCSGPQAGVLGSTFEIRG